MVWIPIATLSIEKVGRARIVRSRHLWARASTPPTTKTQRALPTLQAQAAAPVPAPTDPRAQAQVRVAAAAVEVAQAVGLVLDRGLGVVAPPPTTAKILTARQPIKAPELAPPKHLRIPLVALFRSPLRFLRLLVWSPILLILKVWPILVTKVVWIAIPKCDNN